MLWMPRLAYDSFVVCPCFLSAGFLCGGAGILFGKFWLAGWLVRFANPEIKTGQVVYGCEALGIFSN